MPDEPLRLECLKYKDRRSSLNERASKHRINAAKQLKLQDRKLKSTKLR